ncbi:MAG TPA: pyridoxal-phosphate dependent enzyme [Chloroflexota bacterium]|nr:pyridoxal-phosphate dependent enzyme [Chloroflexota bacterium]
MNTSERLAREPAHRSRTGVWRFGDRLPGSNSPRLITLGEGGTPLIHLPRWGAAHGLNRVFAKLEYTNPTGSFKDRGMAVLVTAAVAGGAQRLVEDSSGNAGASAAAFAARAGIHCTVFAPAEAPAAKLRQIRAYGATLIEVPGPRSAVTEAARRAGSMPGTYHVSHNDNPLFVPGNKTFAYEVVEDLAGDLPRGARSVASGAWHVVVPTGGGALFLGAWQGFLEELVPERGMSRPRMHAAQTAACAPLAGAWDAGLIEPAPIERQPSVCGGIEIERPSRGQAILAAVRESGGSAVASQEAAILHQRDRLAELEGIYAEPTSAAAVAGLAELASRGIVGREDIVVVAITGTGIKDPGPA